MRMIHNLLFYIYLCAMAFSFFKSKEEIQWIPLTSMEQLDTIQATSIQKPQIIFKHSTTCSISRMAYNRMVEGLDQILPLGDIYYLDLLANRAISNEIANKWEVVHESPQILIIKNGHSVYDTSHNMISPSDIKNHLS
jgi:bacillithiol system protein YtxJ